VHAGEAVLLEIQGDLHAAAAVVADGDDLVLLRELGDARLNLSHRHEPRAGDARLVVFPGLAHVEQQRRLAVVVRKPRRQLRRADLLDQFRT